MTITAQLAILFDLPERGAVASVFLSLSAHKNKSSFALALLSPTLRQSPGVHSHRGTKVNGRLFTGQLELQAGDRIRVHEYVLCFVP